MSGIATPPSIPGDGFRNGIRKIIRDMRQRPSSRVSKDICEDRAPRTLEAAETLLSILPQQQGMYTRLYG